jgi:hypothetical protein
MLNSLLPTTANIYDSHDCYSQVQVLLYSLDTLICISVLLLLYISGYCTPCCWQGKQPKNFPTTTVVARTCLNVTFSTLPVLLNFMTLNCIRVRTVHRDRQYVRN